MKKIQLNEEYESLPQGLKQQVIVCIGKYASTNTGRVFMSNLKSAYGSPAARQLMVELCQYVREQLQKPLEQIANRRLFIAVEEILDKKFDNAYNNAFSKNVREGEEFDSYHEEFIPPLEAGDDEEHLFSEQSVFEEYTGPERRAPSTTKEAFEIDNAFAVKSEDGKWIVEGDKTHFTYVSVASKDTAENIAKKLETKKEIESKYHKPTSSPVNTEKQQHNSLAFESEDRYDDRLKRAISSCKSKQHARECAKRYDVDVEDILNHISEGISYEAKVQDENLKKWRGNGFTHSEMNETDEIMENALCDVRDLLIAQPSLNLREAAICVAEDYDAAFGYKQLQEQAEKRMEQWISHQANQTF